MALIKQFTLEDLTNDVILKNKSDPKFLAAARNAGGINTTKCRAYQTPITNRNIKTAIEIKSLVFPAASSGSGQSGVTGTVFIIEEPEHILFPTYTPDRIPMFSFHTNRDTKDAHTAMYDICQLAADNIKAILREHEDVIRYDCDMTVSIEHSGNTYEASVRDLLRRRNTVFVRKKNGLASGRVRITKTEAAELLEQAAIRYADILTPRKLERLSLLVQEYKGLRPTVKQYQRTLREKSTSIKPD